MIPDRFVIVPTVSKYTKRCISAPTSSVASLVNAHFFQGRMFLCRRQLRRLLLIVATTGDVIVPSLGVGIIDTQAA